MTLPYLPIIISYLLGSIPFGLVIARIWGISDIRSHGSGNIGATNVWRIAGWKAGVGVFIFDIGKGILAILAAKVWSSAIEPMPLREDVWLAVCGCAAICGHIFPVFLGFSGGKGVNTALGVMLILLPLQSAVAVVAFIITLVASRFVSLSSMVAAVAFAGFACYQRFVTQTDISDFLTGVSVVIAIVIIATHNKNIVRIMSGTESKVRFKKATRRDEKNVSAHV